MQGILIKGDNVKRLSEDDTIELCDMYGINLDDLSAYTETAQTMCPVYNTPLYTSIGQLILRIGDTRIRFSREAEEEVMAEMDMVT